MKSTVKKKKTEKPEYFKIVKQHFVTIFLNISEVSFGPKCIEFVITFMTEK